SSLCLILRGFPLRRLTFQYLSEKREDFALKARDIEAFRVAANCGRIEILVPFFKGLDGVGEALRHLLVEPDAGRCADGWTIKRYHRFGRSAATVGDHRGPARLSFYRDDAEIFFTGEKQRPAALEVRAQNVVALPAQELHTRTGKSP